MGSTSDCNLLTDEKKLFRNGHSHMNAHSPADVRQR